MPLRITFNGDKVGREYKATMANHARIYKSALRDAADDARDLILKHGRTDISNAGNFGRRWTEGLKGEIVERPNGINLNITHDVPYFSVFQFGKVIHGKPLLFIPFSFAKDAQGVRARDFPGGLFRVTRKADGLVMLFSLGDKQPKYFGKESVKIPKKFHVIEIVREVARNIKLLFVDHLSRQRRNG